MNYELTPERQKELAAPKLTIREMEELADKAREKRDLEDSLLGTPGSAVCCYILAWLCACVGAVWLIYALTADGNNPAAPALGVLVSAVLWWALGNIVCFLHRLSCRLAAK